VIDKDYNLLPLDSWRRIFGFNPWHFWGFVADMGNARLTSSCLDIVTEYAWQDVDSAGREEIRQALISAEGIVRTWGGFWPAPVYAESTVPYPRLADLRMSRRAAIQPDWRRLGVQLPDAHIQAIGVEARTLIGQATVGGGTLAYSDAFSSGLDDTFTITLPIPVGMALTAEQVAVYVTAADRIDGAPLSERWRIAPVRVTLAGGNVVIVGRRWLCGLPAAYEGMDGEGLDATDPANFVTALDVYRRTTDPDGQTLDDCQAIIEWETRPCHGWWCACGCQPATTPATSSTDPAAVARAIARCGIRDAEIGTVHPATSVYNSAAGVWSETWPAACWESDRVTVRYLAGRALRDAQMQPQWAQAVARCAAAELVRPICACEAANKELYRWQFDLATATSEAEQYQLDPSELTNPIGTRRGHVAAWKLIARSDVVQGFIPG
jgi:hypothetical protein